MLLYSYGERGAPRNKLEKIMTTSTSTRHEDGRWDTVSEEVTWRRDEETGAWTSSEDNNTVQVGNRTVTREEWEAWVNS